jgi:A/G-specific adenine glycosylase
MNQPADSHLLNEKEIREIRLRILAWGEKNIRTFPWRSPEKIWHGLVAEVLLQRTRAESVVPVYKKFTQQFPEPEDLATATEEEILDVIRSLGLHWRAPLLKKMGESLVQAGGIPETVDGLQKLPGIGVYTSNAFLSFHGDSPGVLIDSNIVRWISRLIGREYDGETRRKKWLRKTVMRLTPDEDNRAFNYASLDFTMTVCRPKSPECPECPIGNAYCSYARGREEG